MISIISSSATIFGKSYSSVFPKQEIICQRSNNTAVKTTQAYLCFTADLDDNDNLVVIYRVSRGGNFN